MNRAESTMQTQRWVLAKGMLCVQSKQVGFCFSRCFSSFCSPLCLAGLWLGPHKASCVPAPLYPVCAKSHPVFFPLMTKWFFLFYVNLIEVKKSHARPGFSDMFPKVVCHMHFSQFFSLSKFNVWLCRVGCLSSLTFCFLRLTINCVLWSLRWPDVGAEQAVSIYLQGKLMVTTSV